MTDRYAVIGNPVDHSLSPRIHTTFAARTREDIEYGRLEAPTDGFVDAARTFFTAGGSGLNVTLPFKLDAWQWVDGHDDAAASSGAVNTIVVDGNGTRGCNTDGIGLVRDLLDNLGWDLDGARTLVLGAGGAAQGVIEPLRCAGATDLTIANRTRRKAQGLAARFGVASAGLDEVGGGWDVVLNGTAAGLAGSGGLVAPEVVTGSRCYDMFYSLDGATPFCRWAADQDASAVSDGLGMLIEQAAEAFLLWRGVRPDTDGIAKVLRSGA
ncbi:MAG: shikimate dehydrogenase [Gammaproteobacteria bacterium]|nr:shikimate dehydrogenase [Gammaproteobacteria bacterium]